jgi:hypothetical protein
MMASIWGKVLLEVKVKMPSRHLDNWPWRSGESQDGGADVEAILSEKIIVVEKVLETIGERGTKKRGESQAGRGRPHVVGRDGSAERKQDSWKLKERV